LGENSRIVAVDLQQMAPLPRVQVVQGDITSVATVREVWCSAVFLFSHASNVLSD
jgi:23S rRNA U2552 (ribose-2'-O)-methylase RlmE/FtsJ